MTETEKKLLQAKHRLEEAEMRDRQKERKDGENEWQFITWKQKS